MKSISTKQLDKFEGGGVIDGVCGGLAGGTGAAILAGSSFTGVGAAVVGLGLLGCGAYYVFK